MGHYFIAEFFESKQVSQLMQKSDQERKFIQVAVYANPVISEMSTMPIVSEDAFSFPGYRQMYFVKL
jgi:hypothetical protein